MSARRTVGQAAGEPVSPGAVVDEAIGSHADPPAPGDVSSPGAAVDEAIGSGEEPPAARGQALTHIDSSGQARMVDVSGKDVTARTATATGRVLLSPAAVAALRDGTVPKGDALAVARVAAIQGAKRTPDLVPLCHPIGLHGVTVDLTVADDGVDIAVTTRTADRTGVEMESLTAVTVGALALIDMLKAIDPAAVITDVKVLEKTGGKTGHWTRP
jgi:cyclic pyranopterin monophosphate synthase